MDQHCKNSTVRGIKKINIKVGRDEGSISHDVVSVFTETAVTSTTEKWLQKVNPRKHTKLTVQHITQLLQFRGALLYSLIDFSFLTKNHLINHV